ncbi:MAG: RNA methyltransferase [Candidatus Njordarchaeia archaeon]
MEIIFVLVRPKYSGNIGHSARVIKNFGFKKLVLVNPVAEIDYYADLATVHAKDVLHSAKIYSSIQEFMNIEKVKFLIGTTARVGGEKNPLRTPLPSNSIRNLKIPDAKIGVLFGNEESGLSNEELSFCDIVVTIPTSEEYPVLNLSHAVGIIAYEFSLMLSNYRLSKHRASTTKEREILLTHMYKLVDILTLPEERREIYKGILRNLVNRAFLTGREVHTLIGIFKKASHYLSKCKDMDNPC